MRRWDTTNKDLEYLHTTLAALCLQNAQQVNSASSICELLECLYPQRSTVKEACPQAVLAGLYIRIDVWVFFVHFKVLHNMSQVHLKQIFSNFYVSGSGLAHIVFRS